MKHENLEPSGLERVNIPPLKGIETGLSSVSPSSEQWRDCGLCVVS